MNDQPHPATYEQKIEFLMTVLESEEKRRESVENRFSVLIASNAILLSVIIGWGLPSTISGNAAYWLQVALTMIALSTIILSTLWCAQILAPVGGQKRRARIMDLGPDPEKEYNLFAFNKICLYGKTGYSKEINSLTQNEILEQLTSQVHNVSRLLRHRYDALGLAHKSFVAGAFTFAVLALIKLLVG